ncbi:MAG: Fructose dehydrogenase cytochrome subunit [Deltaproteobacteria bacterium]|jgi:mono/diheme cytochrome c family protein|nr:Fructose dehydrogenase cytochrome subunit [Deltaproteobacteria bacterium]
MIKSFFISVLFLVLATNHVSAEPSVERGEYLVRGPAACGGCHTPMGPLTDNKHDKRIGPIPGMEMAGHVGGDPFGQVSYTNLTPAGPIAEWSDKEVIRAIREGVRPDGSVVGPPMLMPMYKHLSDNDAKSIVMYLRTLPAVKNDLPPSKYNMPLPPSYGPPVGHVADIPRENKVEYGAYLFGPVAHCIICHSDWGEEGEGIMEFFINSPDFKGLMSLPGLGHGGMVMEGPWGKAVAANLTSDPTALGRYTDDEIKKMITHGVHPSGMKLMPPMPYENYALMTDEDLDALITYMRTIPPHPVSD